MKLAIIPARGGSKRIPKKNIRLFNDKPMIAWSIETAITSGCFDHVVVSTDCAEIRDLAIQYGAEVPFIRPSELSDDYTGTIPVIAHAIQQCESFYGNFSTEVCCIYATAPFITSIDLQKSYALLESTVTDYVFSITKYHFPIQRAIVIDEEQNVRMLKPDLFSTRSQDLQETYHDAGQFYWGKTEAWKQQKMIFSPSSKGYYIPTYRVQDIDSLEDWIRAEWLHKYLHNQPHENRY